MNSILSVKNKLLSEALSERLINDEKILILGLSNYSAKWVNKLYKGYADVPESIQVDSYGKRITYIEICVPYVAITQM